MIKANRLGVLMHRVCPLFQADGFVDSNGAWRRISASVINCLEFQVRSDDGACCVNLGVHFAFLPGCGALQQIPSSKLSVVECEIKSRLKWSGEDDHWWSFEDAEIEAADIAACYESTGRAFFEQFALFPRPFTDLGIQDVISESTANLFPMMTKVRKILLLARIHDHLGNKDTVVQFCNAGIEVAGRASAPKAAFRELLRKYSW